MDKLEISYRFSVKQGDVQINRVETGGITRAVSGSLVRDRFRLYSLTGWLLVVGMILAVSIVCHMFIGLNNDHRALMDQTRKLVGGAIPYVDYTDVTPPLIHLIYSIPMLLHLLSGMQLHHALYLFVYALTALSLFASERILFHAGVSQAGRIVTVSAAALALLTVSFIHQAFADREHMMMTLATPWFVLFSPLGKRASAPRRWRVVAALMAGVGFAIKPYFYIFYFATIACELLAGRTLRDLLRETEHHIVCGIGIAYLAVVFAFFPEYPYTILPVGWQTYGVVGWSWGDKLNVLTHELLPNYVMAGAAAVGLLWFFAPRLCDWGLAYLAALMLACMASYLMNGGWYYTQYPLMAMSFVLAVVAGAKLLSAANGILNRQRRVLGLAGVLLGLSAAIIAGFLEPAASRAGWDMTLQQERGHTLSTMEMEEKAAQKMDAHFIGHPRFLLLSMNLWGVNFLKEGTPRVSVGRFDYLWPLPGILEMEKKPAKRDAARKLYDWFAGSIAEDIVRHKPDMVIMDVSPSRRNLSYEYNILTNLKTNAAFAKAWRDYEQSDSIFECTESLKENCAYIVYYRKTDKDAKLEEPKPKPKKKSKKAKTRGK